jgi:ketol-acid reductoisomerase
MHLYYDEDADLNLLAGRKIAVIGYGNQGRAQALNLRDSGMEVLVGNREDEYADQARQDGLEVLSIKEASAVANVVLLLIPDELAAEIFEGVIGPQLKEGSVLVFASGYSIAFGTITPPPNVDVVLVAPRMIGAGVRDLYVEGRGFPAFVGVAQDHSGQARQMALALAKGIGSTRAGAVEVTFAQEAELDLFTEQCFGPAFGQVLTTSVDLLLEEGYPPEAVLLELYMSGEFAYTLTKIAELGLVEQAALHSRTSQYGSLSRGVRFMFPELRNRMHEGLEEIRSGRFAEEWAAEQAAGAPTLASLREAARSMPFHKLENELRQALRGGPVAPPAPLRQEEPEEAPETAPQPDATVKRSPSPEPASPAAGDLMGKALSGLLGLGGKRSERPQSSPSTSNLSDTQMDAVLRRFLADAADSQALQAYSQDREMATHYVLRDSDLEFYMRFDRGTVVAELGPPPLPAEVRLETELGVLDGMFTGKINAMRAFMTGKLSFQGEAKLAITIQQVQDELCGIYTQARTLELGS